ncbi:hypothetical protein [Irregularibacter muris]|uniref:hypothetical protein n=1 Tax=Irregularibacter muris TaxID=1796619 RepID=UPI00214C59BC|nr:hypothetical protein [Irregularibacter muris]
MNIIQIAGHYLLEVFLYIQGSSFITISILCLLTVTIVVYLNGIVIFDRKNLPL